MCEVRDNGIDMYLESQKVCDGTGDSYDDFLFWKTNIKNSTRNRPRDLQVASFERNSASTSNGSYEEFRVWKENNKNKNKAKVFVPIEPLPYEFPPQSYRSNDKNKDEEEEDSYEGFLTWKANRRNKRH